MKMSLEENIKEQAKKRPKAHFMLVDGMSKLMSQKVNKCQSSDFYVLGLKWNMIIQSGVEKNSLSCYLMITDKQCVGSNWEVKCYFKLSVVSPTGPDMCIPISECFSPTKESWGRRSFVSYDQLKGNYIVHDKAVFCAEIIRVIPNMPVTSMSQTTGTAERFKLMEVPRNNSKFTWKITQFSSFTSKTHASYEFTVGQRRWRVDMYPNGDKIGVGHYLSLFLTATSDVTNNPKGKTLVVFKLRVLDQLNLDHYESEEITHMFPNDSTDLLMGSWGQSKFLALEELHKTSRGLLVNDQIYIGVEFLFVSTAENL